MHRNPRGHIQFPSLYHEEWRYQSSTGLEEAKQANIKEMIKTDTLRSILESIQKGAHMASIDLLVAYPHILASLQIPLFCIQQQTLSILCSPFWTEVLSQGIYKGSGDPGSTPKAPRKLIFPY